MRSRTQASIAVSCDGERWLLINAAPDLRQQIDASAQLHPRTSPRHSPIRAVLLTGSEVDQVAGLLTLRETQGLSLYATGEVHGILDANPIFQALKPEQTPRRRVPLNELVMAEDAAGQALGVAFELFAVPGKVPLYLEGDLDPGALQGAAGDTVGVEVTAGGRRAVYIPGCARLAPDVIRRIDGADLLLFDGTLWSDDEMIEQGLSQKTGARMGHISVGGPEGAIAGLKDIAIARRAFIHLNNSNPLLDDASEQRREANAAGWEISFDGQEFVL